MCIFIYVFKPTRTYEYTSSEKYGYENVNIEYPPQEVHDTTRFTRSFFPKKMYPMCHVHS